MVYLGPFYDKLKREKIPEVLEQLLHKGSKNRPAGHVRSTPEPAREKPRDGLMGTLEGILAQIEKLKKEAAEYKDEHVNQDYRRINAECVKLQMQLDRLDLDGKPDARQLRKNGLRMAEEAAELLDSKTHREIPGGCKICLKLA